MQKVMMYDEQGVPCEVDAANVEDFLKAGLSSLPPAAPAEAGEVKAPTKKGK